jgi:hypothetical protein
MKPVREACVPQKEVLESNRKDSLFAASFGHIIEGNEGVVADGYSK